MTFPVFPKETEFYDSLGETMKAWCLSRLQTNILSFDVAEGPLTGEYSTPNAIRVSSFYISSH